MIITYEYEKIRNCLKYQTFNINFDELIQDL